MNKEQLRLLETDDSEELTEPTALEIWAEEYVMNNIGERRTTPQALADYHGWIQKINVKDDFTTGGGLAKYLAKISKQMGYELRRKRTSKERYFYITNYL